MTRKKTHKQNFGTHPVPGQSRKFVYVYVFFFPWKTSLSNLVVFARFLALTAKVWQVNAHRKRQELTMIRADFREGDEDSNFSLSRVRRFTESPEPLHWIAFPVEILTKPLIHWIASPLFTENPFFSLKSASSHPLPKNRLWPWTNPKLQFSEVGIWKAWSS